MLMSWVRYSLVSYVFQNDKKLLVLLAYCTMMQKKKDWMERPLDVTLTNPNIRRFWLYVAVKLDRARTIHTIYDTRWKFLSLF